jgi:hypothetical protein
MASYEVRVVTKMQFWPNLYKKHENTASRDINRLAVSSTFFGHVIYAQIHDILGLIVVHIRFEFSIIKKDKLKPQRSDFILDILNVMNNINTVLCSRLSMMLSINRSIIRKKKLCEKICFALKLAYMKE